MKRAEEIREKMREIRKGKRYDFREWMRSYIIPADKKGWNWLIIAGGDVREKMQMGFSELTMHRCKVVEIDTVPHTVLEIRDRFLTMFERARDLRGFYSLLSHKIADGDLRKFHYDLWLNAHNLESKVKRLHDLQTRNIRRPNETERDVFSNTSLRTAARHYGNL